MSVSNSGELLVGSWGSHKDNDNLLHIYNTEGRHVSSIKKLPELGLFLRDAIWTSRGNIVCTSRLNSDSMVTTMTRLGKIIATTKMSDVYRLSVSADVIYLACGTHGVYQSTDDGEKWSLAFACTDVDAWQVVKVSSDINTDVFYVLRRYRDVDWYLSQYTVNRSKRKSMNGVTRRDVALRFNPLFDSISMAFDGRTKVFVSDFNKASKLIRVFSVNDQTESTLDLSEYLNEDDERIHWLAVGTRFNELYVSLTVRGLVKVFTLASV